MRGSFRDGTGIVVGQQVTGEKVDRARQLRRQMTPSEVVLWGALRGGRLQGFRVRRQQLIDGFIVDFYCHAARVVIEVDGGIHDDRRGHDEARDQILERRGLRILRFTNEDVMIRLDEVLAQITRACTERKSEIMTSPPPLRAGEGAGG